MQTIVNKPIGILGGTFDPIHHGHLRIALELYQRLNWQEIRLIPCQIPVLAKKAYATPKQRVAMLQLATANQAGLIIDERELKRTTPSYTIETLISLRAEFPHTPLCLIMGYDALLSLEQWYRWQELLEYAHFVVIPRPTYNIPANGTIVDLLQKHGITDAKRLGEQKAGLILVAELAPLAISSTNIREHIAQGYSPRYLIPDAVWDYIQQENLYKQLLSRK